MKTASIPQPLAWALIGTGLRIANVARLDASKALPLVGQSLLLHASKTTTRKQYDEGERWLNGRGFTTRLLGGEGLGASIGKEPGRPLPRIPYLDDLPLGVIIGRARLVDVVMATSGNHRVPPTKNPMGMICTLCGRSCQAPADNCAWDTKSAPWAEAGSYSLVLTNVDTIDAPRTTRGGAGLFEVPDEVLAGAVWEACP